MIPDCNGNARRGEGAGSTSQQNGYVIATLVRYGKIRNPVAVEITNGNGERISTHCERTTCRGLEVTSPVTQKNRDCRVGIVGNGQDQPFRRR